MTTMFALLVLMTFTVANSQVNDCMSMYLEPTGATCVGTPTACVNSKCTFSAVRWTYLCCRNSTTVTIPVCPATMTPLLGSVKTCRLSNPNTGCPARYSCVQSSVAGTYMCCGGATTGVTTVPPTTTSAWLTAGISPAFVPTPPSTNLVVSFMSTSLIFGQTTTSIDVVDTTPKPPTSVTGFTTNASFRYSLFVVDIDATSNRLRYMMLNVPGSGTNVQSFSGVPVAPSIAINPATFTGSHRFVVLLFQHAAIASPMIPDITSFTIAGFMNTNSASFGNPVAGSYFRVTGTAGR